MPLLKDVSTPRIDRWFSVHTIVQFEQFSSLCALPFLLLDCREAPLQEIRKQAEMGAGVAPEGWLRWQVPALAPDWPPTGTTPKWVASGLGMPYCVLKMGNKKSFHHTKFQLSVSKNSWAIAIWAKQWWPSILKSTVVFFICMCHCKQHLVHPCATHCKK